MLSDAGATALFNLLRRDGATALREINVSDNKIGDLAIMELAAALESDQLPSLESIKLWGNNVGDEALVRIA